MRILSLLLAILAAQVLLQPLWGQTVTPNKEWHLRKQEFAERLVDRIQQSTVQSLVSRYCMRCIGEGASMCGGPIRRISLSFQVVGPLTRNEVRRLLFFIANEMILQASRIPNLDTYLAVPPFSHKNVQVVLFQVDERGAGLRHPTFNACSFNGDSLSYAATDPVGGPWASYKEEIIETYKEALEALRKEYEQYKTAEMLDTSTSE